MMKFPFNMSFVAWTPGIGDPTVVGWVTVVLYFLACGLCFRQWRREKSQKLGNSSYFGVLSALLLVLGINKQLDLQSFITQVGRMILPALGWEQYKRPIQVCFIIFVALLALTLIVWLGLYIFKSAPRHLLSFVGLILLMSFVVIRAASFHHIDRLLGKNYGLFKLNHTLEIGAILIIILGTLGSRPSHGS